ncbi:hypothetical protein BUALT_Bualt04G0065200 [Buddleja alternifolia]|uniref:Uncharacterized protein n=1 Tax=Buddleja alternifolia TaxID=168488 RepID=A0AAV6XR84_9LAMI|nr:hypothetical protein BUALT_Bualt04G0065200 [Buddleja alternifolia]
MSRNYDNWERLVAAVLRREELWQLFHEHSRSPSICSVSSDFSSSWSSPLDENLTSRHSEASGDASHIWAVWEKAYKPGVHITLVALPDGTRFVKRVRFSRMGLEDHQVEFWWVKNREKVYRRYNAWGGHPQIRRASVVVFGLSPLIDHPLSLRPEEGSMQENSDPSSSDEPVEAEASQTTKNEEESTEAEEDVTRASDIPEYEKIALEQLKQLIQEALDNHEFGSSSSAQEEKLQERTVVVDAKASEEVFIWGIKLLEDDKTDVVLLKFLRARDFLVEDAFTMIKKTILWRKEFGIDEFVDEDFGSELEGVVFMYGHSKEGHPVCYSRYEEFRNEEFYQKIFSNEENRQKLLRWRIQFLEKSVRKLDFSPGGVSTIFQVNDLKNFPGAGKLEFREDTNKALKLLQDNYPEFVAKQVFINVPWWYLAFYKMTSPLLTQRTKSKFVFAGPSVAMATLFKYISAEQIPVQYGGLSKDGDIGTTDNITELVMKPSGKQIAEFNVTERCVVSWEVSVVGWEVRYGAEFIPIAEDERAVVIEKTRRIGSTDEEQVISGSFTAYDPGKVVVTISNLSS